MSTFSVVNFDKFQHYKDRRPPWIKLYNDTLSDYEFCKLPDASKAHLIAIWLLASRYNNKIPADAEWLKAQISAHENVDLLALADAGFIELDQACSEMLAERKQSADTETERETDNKPPIVPLAKKSEPSKGRGSRVPEKFPTKSEIDWAVSSEKVPRDAVVREAQKFRDYWLSVAGSRGVKRDWQATWRNWVRKAKDDGNLKSSKQDAWIAQGIG